MIKNLFFIFCISFLPLSYAQDDLANQIKKSIKVKGLRESSLGLAISKIQPDNKVISLYNLNGDDLFIPASLVKIAALSAVYNYYSPSHTFKTSFISSSSINNGVLQGDLVLKGGGDSSFTSESLWNLVNILTRLNIKEIKGNILVDDSLYEKEPTLPYSERSYHAPASASSFNWNSVAFNIRPAGVLKKPALVFIDPDNSYIKVINKVKTGRKNKIGIKKKSFSSSKEVFELRGEIDINKDEIVKYRNVFQPALWLGWNIVSFLNQRGIEVSGQVKRGRCFGSCKVLAEWESRPLAFHTYNLMKYSSNFVARMLVSHLPLLKGETRGNLKQGMKWVESYLQQKEGIKKFRFEEPSGLSRKNKFSPKDLQKILINSRKHFYSSEMLSSYPLAGGKGTLKNRFKDSPSVFVRAKTGSLHGVLGLAGLAGAPDKKENYAFVFIFNGRAGKSNKAQDLFDEIVISLLKNRHF